MPDKSFDVVININSRAEGIAASQAMIADLRTNIDAANVAAAQGNATFEQQAAIQGEINAMIGIRRDLLEAQITGNASAVGLARDELAIHGQTLATLRSEALSHQAINGLLTDQNALLTLAATKQQETAGFSLLAGANLNKAKGEATVLAREIATGSVNARTLGALLGSLGPTLTVGAIGGFALFEIIKRSADEAARLEKEMAKQVEDLFKQEDQWRQLALAAGEFSDVAKLGEKIGEEIDKANEKLTTFRQQQQSWIDWIVKYLPGSVHAGMFGALGGSGKQGEIDQQAQIVAKGLQDAQKLLQTAEESRAAWEKIQLEPAAQGVEDLKTKVAELRAELEKLKPLAFKSIIGATPGEIQAITDAFDNYRRKLALVLIDEERLSGLQKKADRDAEVNQRREVTNLLKEEELILQQIRGDQEVISRNPVLAVGDRDAALHTLSLREQATVLAEIYKIEQEISKLQAIGDPKSQQEVTQLTQKLQALKTEYQLLGFEIQKTTFGGAIRADLANWVNSWGTAAHQIANTIQQTIGTSLEQLNQYIVTGKFNVQDLERQFILFGLRLLEQLALQRIASLLNITTTTTAAATAGQTLAAATSAAAINTSIATYGAADTEGLAAYIAALTSARAASIAGFAEGGFTGNRDERAIAGVVHGGEYVFTAEQTESLGVPFLQQLASGTLTWTSHDPPPTGYGLAMEKFGHGPPLQGYQHGGYINPYAPGVRGAGSFGYISPGQFASNPGAYGIFYDPRSNTYFYYNPSTGQTFWAPIDYSQTWSEPGSLPQPPGIWDPRWGPLTNIGDQGPSVLTAPQWSELGALGLGPAIQDYWAASQTWGQYGVGWFYDANGDPQPASYFQQTGQTPSSGPSPGRGPMSSWSDYQNALMHGNTGVYAPGGPFSSPGVGPQYSPGWGAIQTLAMQLGMQPGQTLTIPGMPGQIYMTDSGQAYSTAIGQGLDPNAFYGSILGGAALDYHGFTVSDKGDPGGSSDDPFAFDPYDWGVSGPVHIQQRYPASWAWVKSPFGPGHGGYDDSWNVTSWTYDPSQAVWGPPTGTGGPRAQAAAARYWLSPSYGPWLVPRGPTGYIAPVPTSTFSFTQGQTDLNAFIHAGSNIGNNLGYDAPQGTMTDIPQTPTYVGPLPPPGNPNVLGPLDPALLGPLTPALLDDLAGGSASIIKPTGRKYHTGGAIDEIRIDAQIGEFMMQRQAVDYYGTTAMDAINKMRIPVDRLSYHEGGYIEPPPPLQPIDDSGPVIPDKSSSKDGIHPSRMPPIKVDVHVYHDLPSAIKGYLDSSEYSKHFVKTMSKNR